jgi:hypothetical protein
MNPLKPRHTLDSVVRELIAGLEDGTITLSKKANESLPEPQRIENFLCSDPLSIRTKASPIASRSNGRHRFVNEWVCVDLDSGKSLPIEFDPTLALKSLRSSK